MSVSLPFFVVAVLVAIFLGWLLRGFMQRTRPDQLAKLDSAGNTAAAKAAVELQQAKDYAKDKLG